METKIRLLRYLRLLSISLCLFSSVHSVPLGSIDFYGNEVIPAKAGIQINIRNENSGSPLEGGDDVKNQQSLETDNFDFYKNYLAKYYPKVFVMCRDYFIGMTAKDFEKSLGSVVDLITREPWFYFVNRSQGFKITRYWELIADQLSWINEFMRTAWYDPTTGRISMPTDDDDDDFLRAFLATGSLRQVKKNEYLDEYLIATGSAVVYDFYALCFDYMIKLFNEALLMGDDNLATRYLTDIEFVIGKLQHSIYEAEYQEHTTTAKELIELLKQRNVSNQDSPRVPVPGA